MSRAGFIMMVRSEKASDGRLYAITQNREGVQVDLIREEDIADLISLKRNIIVLNEATGMLMKAKAPSSKMWDAADRLRRWIRNR